MTRLVALYPQAWRDRYEDEFLSLLADRPPGLSGRLDIVRGALDARLHPQAPGLRQTPEPAHRPRWSVRAGWLTLAGLLAWIGAIAVALQGPVVGDPGGEYRDGSAAAPLYLTAIVLLGIGIAAAGLSLPDRARAGKAGAYVACLIGTLWALGPWNLGLGVIAAAGMAVLAISAWRASQWPAIDAALLVVGQSISWLIAIVAVVAPTSLPKEAMIPFFLSLSTAWVAIGHALLHELPADAPSRGESTRS